jgi:hypothetical protein
MNFKGFQEISIFNNSRFQEILDFNNSRFKSTKIFGI